MRFVRVLRREGRLGLVLGVVMVALALTGCGVRPTGVVDAGGSASGLTKGLRLYFVSESGRLEGVPRPDQPIRAPVDVVKLLMGGPSEAEKRSGLTTLLTDGQYEVTGEGDRLSVRLSGMILDPTSVRDRNLTGQLVCSLARARAVLDESGRTRPDDVRVTVASEGDGTGSGGGGGELGPYVCSDFLG
ncbi:hypothetical protein [Streptomyces alboniger]|uniref:hypothetical protein n=1 Tax=Streptomyces alboniger TaxID=132473 RepID=UPI00201DEA5B|nr:hypothetical protein [Streptomyces alboniger]